MTSAVTSHAVVRFLERVRHVDVEAHGWSLKAMQAAGIDVSGARALLEDVVADAVAVGASMVVRDGFEFILAGGRLVTVSPRHRGGGGCAGKGKARMTALAHRSRRGPDQTRVEPGRGAQA